MDSVIQQMNHNPLDKYLQNLLSYLVKSDCMVGEMVQNSGNSSTFRLTGIY